MLGTTHHGNSGGAAGIVGSAIASRYITEVGKLLGISGVARPQKRQSKWLKYQATRRHHLSDAGARIGLRDPLTAGTALATIQPLLDFRDANAERVNLLSKRSFRFPGRLCCSLNMC